MAPLTGRSWLRERGRAAGARAAAQEVRLAVTRSFLEGVADAARAKAVDLSPREVSTLCWAFGRLNVSAPELLDSLCLRALPRLPAFRRRG